MKINSKKLWDYIFNLGTYEKAKFKVYYDDNYLTEIYWDGDNFNWEPGKFTSGAFFNPLYDFAIIEEEQDIEYEDICEWGKEAIKDIKTNERYKTGGLEKYVSVLAETQNEIIRNQQKIIKEVNKLKKEIK